MQTITVKYLGPTNTKPSRLRATSTAGISITQPYSLPEETADYMGYNRIAKALKDKLGWKDHMIGGHLGQSSAMVYVFATEDQYRI